MTREQPMADLVETAAALQATLLLVGLIVEASA
jgi:hypothetical protein